MNFPARYIGLAILGALLAMPVITLNGGLHLLILLFCVVILRKEILAPGVWPLCLLGLYALFIGSFYVSGFGEIKKINSQQMRQISILLLAFVSLRGATLKEIQTFFSVVLLTAVVGVLGEMSGRNMHDYLPTKETAHDYYKDAMFLSSGLRRYRGFFTESSVLLAATTCFGVTSLSGALSIGRKKLGTYFFLGATLIAAVSLAFLQIVVYAKTGLLIAAAGALGAAIARVLKLRREQLPVLLTGCMVAVVLSGIALLFVPASIKDYLEDDLSALPLALEGNKLVEQTSSGLLTRIECWRLAIETVVRHPLGVGFYGIEQSYRESNTVTLNGELKSMFGLEIYGLKNTFANVLAQTGIPGIALLFVALFQSFIAPWFRAPAFGIRLSSGTAALYLAGLGMSLLFLATCESYYWMALIIILKCYADAVAESSASQDEEFIEAEI